MPRSEERMSERLKIVNIVGARPNLPKIAPLMREMRARPEVEPFLIHTGQHYDEALSDIFFRQMGIPSPQVNLGVGSGSHAVQTSEVLRRIEPILIEQKPHVVLVVGDVNSTIASALAAVKLGIRIAHVEAGLRSFDRSMPEEINRVLTDALADYLFVTEKDAIENLRREGRPRESIHFVGNVMIDSLQHSLSSAGGSTIGESLDLKQGSDWRRFAILTLHRPSNVDSVKTLTSILDAINTIANDLRVIFPVHPRTQQHLAQAGIAYHSNVTVIPPLGYLDFLCLMSNSTLVLTDSGGIQEETTALRVPCLTLRENTERPVTVSQGTNVLVGTDPAKIVAAASKIVAGVVKTAQMPPLWDGHAAKRIVDVLVRDISRS
jgi:UDP-N-acetylglucosamine 2-epimerase (non-hydrolysing)